MLRRGHVDVDMVVRTRRETAEQGEAMSVHRPMRRGEERGRERERERERVRTGEGGEKENEMKRETEKGRDGRILCQSLIK